MLFSFNLFELIVAFSNVFRGYSNATLGSNGLKSHTYTTYKNPKFDDRSGITDKHMFHISMF